MYKMMGLILLFSASVITGFFMARELNSRINTLKDIHKGAIDIKGELEYRGSPLEECFRLRGTLFSNAWKKINEKSLLPKDAFTEACNDLENINDADREILISYGKNLSAEDLGSQIANINWLIENIDKRIKEAETEYLVKGKLYKSGGTLVGLGIVILLL